MKCRSCSAPLAARNPLCAYCGTRNAVDLAGIHEFTVARPDSGRVCPGCGARLETIDVGAGETFLIERCPECFGLFFDSGELEVLLVRSVGDPGYIDRPRLDALGREVEVAPVRYVSCPVCGTLMNRVAFGSRSGVVADRCRDHGVWLDAGELRRLLEWRKAGGQLHHERAEAERALEEQARQREREELARALARSGGSTADPEPPAAFARLLFALADRFLR